MDFAYVVFEIRKLNFAIPVERFNGFWLKIEVGRRNCVESSHFCRLRASYSVLFFLWLRIYLFKKTKKCF